MREMGVRNIMQARFRPNQSATNPMKGAIKNVPQK